MKQIRQGTFETNSSSMHSVTIRSTFSPDWDKLYVDPDTNMVECRFGEFGWGIETYIDAETKLSYLLTLIAEIHRSDFTDIQGYCELDDFKMVEDVVRTKSGCDGIDVKEEIDSYQYSNGNTYARFHGYIDHQSCEGYHNINDFLDDWNITCEEFIYNTNVKLVIDNDNH